MDNKIANNQIYTFTFTELLLVNTNKRKYLNCYWLHRFANIKVNNHNLRYISRKHNLVVLSLLFQSNLILKMKFSQLSFCSWHQIQINSDESPLDFYSRMINFVSDHSTPEDVGDLLNDKKDIMSISILNLVAVEWMYRININLPSRVQTHFTDQLLDGKTSVAHLVPKIIEQLEFLMTQKEEENAQIIEKESGTIPEDEEHVKVLSEGEEEEIVEQDSSADEDDDDRQENEDLELERDTKRRFFCQTCNKSFLKGAHLREHVNYTHLKLNHPCDECDHVASRDSLLKMHKKVAHRGLKFSCSECD